MHYDYIEQILLDVIGPQIKIVQCNIIFSAFEGSDYSNVNKNLLILINCYEYCLNACNESLNNYHQIVG